MKCIIRIHGEASVLTPTQHWQHMSKTGKETTRRHTGAQQHLNTHICQCSKAQLWQAESIDSLTAYPLFPYAMKYSQCSIVYDAFLPFFYPDPGVFRAGLSPGVRRLSLSLLAPPIRHHPTWVRQTSSFTAPHWTIGVMWQYRGLEGGK